MSPRRSVLASVAAGCCLAASVVAGGYAASGAMPFSDWPGGIFSSGGAAEVALAPAERAAAPVVALPAPVAQEEARTQVIPIDDVEQGPPPAADDAPSTPQRARETTRQADEKPDTSPTTAPAGSAPKAPEPAAAPAEPAPAPTPVARAARRVKLNNPTATFASASTSGSGQPELTVQMAVADETQAAAATSKTVALSLTLAPTDVQALMRTAAAVKSSRIALETEVDVVDATIAEPGCADGTCLRVQMKFAPDTRPNPTDEPEVQVLEEGTSISNKVKVVVQIDAEAIGGMKPTAPADPDPAPDAGAPTVLSLPLPSLDDPTAPPAAPASDTATVALPDDANPSTPDAPSVQIQAQLDVVETPPVTEPPAGEPVAAEPVAAQPVAEEPAATQAQDCPPGQE